LILTESFYSRGTVEVARELLGKVIVHGETAGRIVEVEAYLGLEDMASHAYRGATPRAKIMFGPPGRVYVYLIYGMYECMNLVTEPDGTAGAVLIRALEPVAGVETMFKRRRAAKRVEDLCSGPGKLTLAMGITRAHNGWNATVPGDLYLERNGRSKVEIVTTPRIGITKCADWPLRFLVKGSRFVSGPVLTG
jgi:DNA-3-methyladenine glycosylase